MSAPFLSIIVPIYKVERYLCECIDSILSQTFTDFELILVDDGSPDTCPQICDEYAESDNRIKVIHKQNGGLVSARKAGLENSIGKYVGFVDGDDWIHTEMYEKMCNMAVAKDVDIAVCNFVCSYDDKDVNIKEKIASGYYDKEMLLKYVYPRMIYSGTFFEFGVHPAVWNKLFKKEVLVKNLQQVNNDITIGEDAVCSFPCLIDANSIFILEEYLYYYRQHSQAMTKSYDKRFFDRIMKVYGALININIEKNIYDISSQINYYMFFMIRLTINNEFNVDNKMKFKENLNQLHMIFNDKRVVKIFEKISIKGFNTKDKMFYLLIKKKLILLLVMIYKIKNFISYLRMRLLREVK